MGNALNGLQKCQDPTVFTANFQEKLNGLVRDVEKIMNTPKPKPPPPADEKKPEESAENKPEGEAAPATSETKTDTENPTKNDDQSSTNWSNPTVYSLSIAVPPHLSSYLFRYLF